MGLSKTAKIYVAGHSGMVGSAIVRRLKRGGYHNLCTAPHAELDLTDQRSVFEFLSDEKPDFIFIAAAKVGGILPNSTHRAEFIYDNLAIEANLIHGAFKAGIDRLCFLGSSCIYPRECPQPIKEEFLLSGPLEETNKSYAIAKIAGISLCESYNDQYGTDYWVLMPSNLYGPKDNFDLEASHVLPALIRKVHEAKSTESPTISVWGSGNPRREFLHVDDLADACVFLMEKDTTGSVFNVGSGSDLTIKELAETVCSIIGFKGDIIYDNERPDGTPQKLLDSSRLQKLGWTATTSLRDGIEQTYASYLEGFAKYKNFDGN
jgi:GDP-L-fucose synthase